MIAMPDLITAMHQDQLEDLRRLERNVACVKVGDPNAPLINVIAGLVDDCLKRQEYIIEGLE